MDAKSRGRLFKLRVFVDTKILGLFELEDTGPEVIPHRASREAPAVLDCPDCRVIQQAITGALLHFCRSNHTGGIHFDADFDGTLLLVS